MRFRFFFLFFLTSSILGYSQTHSMMFEKTWGEQIDNGLWYADELPNGDFILMGGKRFYAGGATQNYACRIDSKGNLLWEKDWGNQYEMDGISKVLALADGTYLAVGSGYSGTGGISDVTATKIDADGTILFHQYYDFYYQDGATDVIACPDNSFVILAGVGTSTNYYPAFIKIDNDGNELWRQTETTLHNYSPLQIEQTPDNGFVVSGLTDGYRNSYHAKYTVAGIQSWIKYPYGLADTISNRPQALRVNSNGSFDIYYGVYYTTGVPEQLIQGVYTRYDASGNSITSTEYAKQLIFFTTDPRDSSLCGIADAHILYKIDASSALEKQVELEDNADNLKEINNFIVTSDGGYLGVGQSHPDDNTPRAFYMAKFSKDGRYIPDSFLETVAAYPNPSFDGKVIINFDMPTEETVAIRIVSSNGVLVYSTEVLCPANSHTEIPVQLDLGSTANGLYILEVVASGEYKRQKLLVMQGK